jgi:hypothetical protein
MDGMRTLIALAALAVAGIAVAIAGILAADVDRPPILPAAAGALVGVVDAGRRDALVQLDPHDLRERSPRLALRMVASATALSPDGQALAIGDGSADRVTIVDLRRWRIASTLRVPDAGRSRQPGVVGLSWPRRDRLLVLGGAAGWHTTLSLVDPRADQPPRAPLWVGAAVHASATARGMVLLGVPQRRSGIAPARVVFADADGAVATARLARLPAGTRPGADIQHFSHPALAADAGGRRAIVIGKRLAAVVTRDGAIGYHELRPHRSAVAWLRDLVEPAAHAGGIPMAGTWREARLLADGTLAVSGYGADPPRSRKDAWYRQRPLGLTLIDTHGDLRDEPSRVDARDWAFRTAATGTTAVHQAGSIVLASAGTVVGSSGAPTDERPAALVGVDANGKRRFERFRGAWTTVLGAHGRRAYVVVREGRGPETHVIDLRDGRTLRVARGSALQQLIPVAAGPAVASCSYGVLGERSCQP